MTRVAARRAAAVACVLGLTACSPGGGATGAARKTRALAPVVTARCSGVAIDDAFRGYDLVDRRLPALSKTLLGRRWEFRAGSRRLEVVIGPNVLDELEDLELVGHAAPAGMRTLEVLRSGVLPETVVVIWREPGRSGQCARMAVVAHRVPEDEVLRVISALRALPGGSGRRAAQGA